MLKPRLEKFHENIVCEDFILLYNFKNIASLTSFERWVLNSTSNRFTSSSISVIESFCGWLIGTGQKCVITRARKSIAGFEIRKSNLIGLKMTCRKRNIWILLDKLLIWVLPYRMPTSSRAIASFFNNSRSISSLSLSSSNEKTVSRRNKQNTALLAYSKKEVLRIESKKMQDKSFFLMSHRSARSAGFPELSRFDMFFDSLPGFALSCTVKNLQQEKNIEGYKKSNINLINLSQSQKQWITAFQYPDIWIENKER